MKTRVLMITLVKGGGGKTTSAAALADVLAGRRKKKVLLIDCDYQCNLSKRFGYNGTSTASTLDTLISDELDIFEGDRPGGSRPPIEEYITSCQRYSYRKKKVVEPYENLKIIAAAKPLMKVWERYHSLNAHFTFKKIIDEIRALNKFDYIIIDSRPDKDYVIEQIMYGVDYVITPVTPNNDAFSGANDTGVLFMRIQRALKNFNGGGHIEFLGAFINKLKGGSKIKRLLEETIHDVWGDNPLFETRIPFCQDVENAEFEGHCPVTTYASSCPASIKFVKLADEIVKKIDEYEKSMERNDKEVSA